MYVTPKHTFNPTDFQVFVKPKQTFSPIRRAYFQLNSCSLFRRSKTFCSLQGQGPLKKVKIMYFSISMLLKPKEGLEKIQSSCSLNLPHRSFMTIFLATPLFSSSRCQSPFLFREGTLVPSFIYAP